MSYGEVKATLKENGWTIPLNSTKITAEKTVNSDKYRINVQFNPVSKGDHRSAKISYSKVYNSSKVDIDMMRSLLVDKYGEPYSEFRNGENRLHIRFSDAGNSVPQERDIIAQCTDEIISSGKQAVPALARGEARNAISQHLWRIQGNEKVKKLCPNTLPAFEEFIEKIFAPSLIAGIGSRASGSGGSVSRTLEWRYPYEKYFREQELVKKEVEANKPMATLDDEKEPPKEKNQSTSELITEGDTMKKPKPVESAADAMKKLMGN